MKTILFLLAACFAFVNDLRGFELESPAFRNGDFMPDEFTCKGKDISPPLSWKNAPEGVKSFVVICDDPDAPAGTWDHWVIFNIPAASSSLDKGVPKEKELSDGSLQGKNSWGKVGYGGPCPPPGSPHRYFFRIYALDAVLSLSAGAAKTDVMKAIKGHVVAEAQIMGRFKR